MDEPPAKRMKSLRSNDSHSATKTRFVHFSKYRKLPKTDADGKAIVYSLVVLCLQKFRSNKAKSYQSKLLAGNTVLSPLDFHQILKYEYALLRLVIISSLKNDDWLTRLHYKRVTMLDHLDKESTTNQIEADNDTKNNRYNINENDLEDTVDNETQFIEGNEFYTKGGSANLFMDDNQICVSFSISNRPNGYGHCSGRITVYPSMIQGELGTFRTFHYCITTDLRRVKDPIYSEGLLTIQSVDSGSIGYDKDNIKLFTFYLLSHHSKIEMTESQFWSFIQLSSRVNQEKQEITNNKLVGAKKTRKKSKKESSNKKTR